MPDSCERCLKVQCDCEGFVEYVSRRKGFKIEAVDQHGYDIEASYPSGMYYYFIEVKYGPATKLSGYQHYFKWSMEAAREVGFNVPTDKNLELVPKYVLCQFDDKLRLIGDRSCKKLLR